VDAWLDLLPIDDLIGGLLPTVCDHDAYHPSVAVTLRKTGAYDIDAGLLVRMRQ
jgi:hypothetical protein